MSRFLRFFAVLLFATVSVPVFAAGYDCPTVMQYTSCASGYYMTKTTSTSDKTFYGTIVSGNDCKECSTLGTVSTTNGITCTGGTAEPTVTCAAGKYWSGTSCTTCTAGYYCPGFKDAKISNLIKYHGRTQCTGATYSGSGQSSCTPCPTGYTTNTTAGKTDITQCVITCPPGTRVAAPGEGCTTPGGAWYSEFTQTINYYDVSNVSYCPQGYDYNSTYEIPNAHYGMDDCISIIDAGKYVPNDHATALLIRVYADYSYFGGNHNPVALISELMVFPDQTYQTNLMNSAIGGIGENLHFATDGIYEFSDNYATCHTNDGGCVWNFNSIVPIQEIQLALPGYGTMYSGLRIEISEDGNAWTTIFYADQLETSQSNKTLKMTIPVTGLVHTCLAGTAKRQHSLNVHETSNCDNCGPGTFSRTNAAATCTNCVTGAISTDTKNTACYACTNGYTTSGAGKNSCNTSCSNSGHAYLWESPVWTYSSNTVTNLCTISSCQTGYVLTSNACVAGTYTVTLNQNGGTDGSDSVTATYDSPMPTATMPTRAKNVFKGYFDAATAGNQYYSPAGESVRNWDKAADTDLYAQWSACASCAAGTGATCSLSVVNNACTYTTSCKTGYSNIVGNGTATPSCTPNTYTVTLSAPDATTAGTESVTATYNVALPLITRPLRNDWTFEGYFDATNGGTQYYNRDGTPVPWDKTENTTLHAQWTQCTPCNPGAGATCSLSVINNVCTYYGSCKSGYGNITGIDTATPSCTPKTYNVSLFATDATTAGTTSVTATYDADMPTATMPEKTGSNFMGYFDRLFTGGTQYYTATGASARKWDKAENSSLYAQWGTCTPCDAGVGATCSLSVVNNVCTYTTSCEAGYGNITGNGTATPSCTPNTYTVTLSAPDATTAGTASVVATYDAPLPSATMPKRDEWTFKGYFDAITGGNQYYSASGASVRTWTKTANSTLHAQWTQCQACVSSTSADCSLSVVDNVCTYTTSCKTGYNTIVNNGKYNPSCTPSTYTVTLSAPGATTAGTASVTATYDADMPTATMPTKTGSNFTGYFDATTGGTQYYTATGTSARKWNKTANTTLHAQWSTCTPCSAGTGANCSVSVVNNVCTYTTSCKTGYGNIQNNGKYNPSCTANTYTVTLSAPDATTPGTTSVTATYDAIMPLPITRPERTGWVFSGYFDATTGGTQYYTGEGTSVRNWDKTANTTLHAHWIQCEACSGSNVDCSVSVINNTCLYTTTCKTGYGNIQHEYESNASCTANTYTVTFDKNGGTGGDDFVTATFGERLPAITMPKREGMASFGYRISLPNGTQYYDGLGEYAAIWNIAENTTLYADWLPCTTCAAGTGANCELSVVNNVCTYTTSCKTGYDNIQNNGKYNPSCTPNTYTVTLSAPDATTAGTASVTATYGANMPTATMPVRTGWQFLGYFDAATGGVQYYTTTGASARAWDKTATTTLHAQWNQTSVECEEGKYVKAGELSCTICPIGSYCPGGLYSIASSDQGINACPIGYRANPDTGLSKINECQLKTTPGKFVKTTQMAEETCTAESYCPGNMFISYGSVGGIIVCPTGYTDGGTGLSAVNQCVRSVGNGYHVPTANGGVAKCAAGTAKGLHTVNYGQTSSCDTCTGATYSGEGAATCTTCPTGYTSDTTNGKTSIDMCKIDVPSGSFINSAGGSPVTCTSGSFCTGGIINYGDTGGIVQCPAGYTDGGTNLDSINDCAIQTTAGKYIATANSATQSECEIGFYCQSTLINYGSVGGDTACPIGYRNGNTGAKELNQCSAKCAAGYFVDHEYAGCKPLTTDDSYTDDHYVSYGESSSVQLCNTGLGYHITGKTNATDHAGIGSCYQTCATESIEPPFGAVKTPKSATEYYPKYCVYLASCPAGFNAIPDGDSYDTSGYTTDPYCESTKFNITFVANGGTMDGAGISYSKECYGAMNCVLNDPEIISIQRSGFIFGGWAKTANGPAVYQNGTNLLDLETTNLNLYAVWEKCAGGYTWNGSTCSICPIGTWMSPGTIASGALKYCNSCGGGNTTDNTGANNVLQCRACTSGNYCGANGGQELSCSALGDGTWTESEPAARLQTECYTECPDYPVTYGTAVADNSAEFYPNKCNYTCISDTGNIGNVVGGKCVENQCKANYYMVNGVCQLCNVENALSYKPGTNCEVQTCASGYHAQGQSCVENTQECTAPYADEAYRTWDNKTSSWSTCVIKTCESGYHVSSNACVADEQTCTVENGRGYREWDSIKNQWGECVVEYCNPGYSFDKSETNEHSKPCGQCKNKFSVLGELAASSYVTGCEIATCMYQGELYNLEGNECVPICDVNGRSDETGTMKWNPSTKKCERKCNDGFTAW